MISELYLKKLMNLVPLTFFDLTDNVLCLFDEKAKFQENDFLNDSVKNIFNLYGELKDVSINDLSSKIQVCSSERQKYFDILSSLLNKMDYIHFISFEKEFTNLLEDEIDAIDYEKIVDNKAFPNLLNISMSCVLPYLNENQRENFVYSLISKNCGDTNLFKLDALLNSVLNKTKLKTKLGKDVFNFHELVSRNKSVEELSEVSELSLKYFHFCQNIFNCYSDFVVLLTYLEEFNLIIEEDLIVKDIYFTTKKIVLENEKVFLEKIREQVEYLLDVHFEEKEKLDKIFAKSNFSEDAKRIEHKYIDSIESLLNEQPHYVGELISDKNNITVLLTNETISIRAKEFLKEFYIIIDNLSEAGKIIIYMSLINNIQVGMKFYGICDNPVSCDTTENTRNVIKNIIETSDTLTRKMVELTFNKFINY